MGSFSALLQEEASILQEQMAMKNSAPPPSSHHNIITWWMLTFLTRSKACFQFKQSWSIRYARWYNSERAPIEVLPRVSA